MAFNEMLLLFRHLSITLAATLILYKFVSFFPNLIINLSLIENYWSDLYEIYRVNRVLYEHFIYVISSDSKNFPKLYYIEL